MGLIGAKWAIDILHLLSKLCTGHRLNGYFWLKIDIFERPSTRFSLLFQNVEANAFA